MNIVQIIRNAAKLYSCNYTVAKLHNVSVNVFVTSTADKNMPDKGANCLFMLPKGIVIAMSAHPSVRLSVGLLYS